MSALRSIVLLLRFLLELALIAGTGAGVWEIAGGGAAGAALATLAAGAVVAVWGLWIAPRASRRLPDPARLGVELALFAAGGLALVLGGEAAAGVALALASAVVAVLVRRLGGEPEPHRR